MTPGLHVERLTVERDGRTILRDLSFHLAPGTAIVVTGSNGAGKSTLLRAVAGLIPRVGGEVVLVPVRDHAGSGFDRDSRPADPRHVAKRANAYPSPATSRGGWRAEGVTGGVAEEGPKRAGRSDTSSQPHTTSGAEPASQVEAPGTPPVPASPVHPPLPGAGEGEPPQRLGSVHADLAEHTSYLGHGNGLKLSLTAAENLRFAAAWAGRSGVSPASALDAVGLAHVADFPVRILSAGQRRRVAIAALLVARRPLWLLEEPATALDALAEAGLAGLLRAHLGRGGLVLAAVHGPIDMPARQLRLGVA